MSTIINLTPHTIHLFNEEGTEEIESFPSQGVARVGTFPGLVSYDEGGYPIAAPDVMSGVQGLPAPKEGVLYLVSAIVGGACKERRDVIVPGTAPKDGAIRGSNGQIIGITRFKRP